jgi:membrane-bound inhibitor of C-type lysozyme
MKYSLTRTTALVLACAALLLGACSSVNVGNLWPLGGSKEQDLTRPPPGATAYQCEGGKRFFVRYLDNGSAAWVILPDREFRLNKVASAPGNRYSNGNAALETSDSAATLWDGATVTHAGCKAAAG